MGAGLGLCGASFRKKSPALTGTLVPSPQATIHVPGIHVMMGLAFQIRIRRHSLAHCQYNISIVPGGKKNLGEGLETTHITGSNSQIEIIHANWKRNGNSMAYISS